MAKTSPSGGGGGKSFWNRKGRVPSRPKLNKLTNRTDEPKTWHFNRWSHVLGLIHYELSAVSFECRRVLSHGPSRPRRCRLTNKHGDDVCTAVGFISWPLLHWPRVVVNQAGNVENSGAFSGWL